MMIGCMSLIKKEENEEVRPGGNQFGLPHSVLTLK